MRKCESCQYEHNHAHNTHCQRCKAPLTVFTNALRAAAEAAGIPVREIELTEFDADDFVGYPTKFDTDEGGEA